MSSLEVANSIISFELKISKKFETRVTGKIATIEGPTKTVQGGLNKRPRMVTQKLYRTGDQ